MERSSRVFLAVPAIAALVFLSVFAARWGAADALANSATKEINTWAAMRSTPGIDTWMWVREDLQRAAQLSPSNPAVPELLGVIHLWRSGRTEFPEAALEHFARALELRPSSPYTWSNVLEARYRLGLTQAPFERILVESWRLGPAQPEVQRLLADLGLAMWNEIAPDTQGVVAAAVAAGMRRNPLEMLAISQRRGRMDPACTLGKGDKRLAGTNWAKICS